MKIERFLPSKRLQKIIFYSFGIIILIFLIKNNFYKSSLIKKDFENREKIEKIKNIQEMNNKDTDGDGLKDWQESLYKTNPEIRDTDLDGVSDFDEVQQNRDPLVFGKGKKEDIITLTGTKEALAGLEDQKKEFEEYKEKLMEKYQKESEGHWNQIMKISGYDKYKKEENKNKFAFFKEKAEINSIAIQILKYENNPKTKNVMRFEKFFVALTKQEDLTITNGDLQFYKDIAQLDLETANNLDSVVVKNEELLKLKKLLANGYRQVGESIKNLIDIFNSGEKVRVEQIKAYGKGQSDILDAGQKIAFFIKTYKIKFEDSEPGIIFDYGL